MPKKKQVRKFSQNTVVIHVEGGVVKVVWKPIGINVVLRDFDAPMDQIGKVEESLYSALDEIKQVDR